MYRIVCNSYSKIFKQCNCLPRAKTRRKLLLRQGLAFSSPPPKPLPNIVARSVKAAVRSRERGGESSMHGDGFPQMRQMRLASHIVLVIQHGKNVSPPSSLQVDRRRRDGPLRAQELLHLVPRPVHLRRPGDPARGDQVVHLVYAAYRWWWWWWCLSFTSFFVLSRWDYKLVRKDYSLNLYPHPQALGQVIEIKL